MNAAADGPVRPRTGRGSRRRRPRTVLEDATRVQDPEGIERGLDGAHDADRVGAPLDLQPLTPGASDPVLATGTKR